MENLELSPMNSGLKVALFLPYASIWNSHAANLNLVEALNQQGLNTVVVGCDEILNNYCGAMTEAGLTLNSSKVQREAVCANCHRRSSLFKPSEISRICSLDTFTSEEDVSEAQKLLAQVSIANWQSITLNGIRVGSAAGYEFFVNNKLTSLDIPPQLFPAYKEQLKTSILVQFAWSRLLERERPHIVIVENEMYSYNRVVGLVSRNFGSAVYSVNHGIDIAKLGNSITLINNPGHWLDLNKSDGWMSTHNVITRDSLRQVRKHIDQLTEGSSPWVYSKPFKSMAEKAIRRKLSISPKASRIIVATTSSLDEPIASDLAQVRAESVYRADDSIFSNQLEWLKFLIGVAREESGIHLVIRVHPRLLPNKRDQVKSDFSDSLASLINELPPNVSMDWPSDGLSLWNTISISDLVSNYSSTAGLEALLLGKPVIQHEPKILHSYPHQLNLTAQSKEEYRSLLAGPIEHNPYDSIVAVHQWLSWKFTVFARNLDNGIPSRRSWTALRVVNGLYLRKRVLVLQKPLQWLEARELKSTRVDSKVARDLRNVLVENLQSLADTHEIPEEAPWDWKNDAIREHAEFLRSKFGRRIDKITILIVRLKGKSESS